MAADPRGAAPIALRLLLSQVVDALRYVEDGHPRGTVVITMEAHVMSKSRPVVVRPDEGTPGPAMPDTERQTWRASWAGWIRNGAGDVSGWHHHAANDTYVYVNRGSLTIHFGPGGAESIVARAGDFFHIPPQTIHRETTSADADLEAFVLRVGGEPEHIAVDGPEESGG